MHCYSNISLSLVVFLNSGPHSWHCAISAKCQLISPLQTLRTKRKPKHSTSSWVESEGASSSLMSHSSWLALNPLRNRCRSIFAKQACDEQTPTKPLCTILTHNQAVLNQIEAPSCINVEQTMDWARGVNQNANSLWAWFLFRGWDIHSLGWWKVHGVCSSFHPSCLLCCGLSNTTVCTGLRKCSTGFELALWLQTQTKCYLYIIIIPTVFY